MYVVAVTRWARPVEQELPELASLFGVAAYDLRLRLMGPVPVVVESRLDEEGARSLLSALRGRGHGAVACDSDKVISSDKMISPRTFSLEEDAFAVKEKESSRIPYAEVMALVLGTRAISQVETTTKVKRKLSMGRIAMTGGLRPSKKTVKNLHTHVEEREQVLYLYPRMRSKPLLLCEFRLHYANLEEFMCPTAGENFASLTTILRARCPEAIYDDRLAGVVRKVSLAAVSRGGKQHTTTHTNTSELDLAAHLVVLGHIQKQF